MVRRASPDARAPTWIALRTNRSRPVVATFELRGRPSARVLLGAAAHGSRRHGRFRALGLLVLFLPRRLFIAAVAWLTVSACSLSNLDYLSNGSDKGDATHTETGAMPDAAADASSPLGPGSVEAGANDADAGNGTLRADSAPPVRERQPLFGAERLFDSVLCGRRLRYADVRGRCHERGRIGDRLWRRLLAVCGGVRLHRRKRLQELRVRRQPHLPGRDVQRRNAEWH